MRHLNALKMHANSMDQSAPVGRWGVVTSADTSSMSVKVQIQPEGVQTSWLPLLSNMVGAGWGIVHVPPVGTQVFLMPDAGDHNSYVVVGATWNTANLPPVSAEGELWLVHSTGSAIKLTNDGKLSIADASGCSLVFGNNGIATLTGTLHVTQNVIAGFGGGDQVTLLAHKHTGVTTGLGTTLAPQAGT